MKKLRLEMDSLRVETFAVAEEAKPRGTVIARGLTEIESCGNSFCPNACSNINLCSMEGTCVYSCQTGPCFCIPQG